MNMKIWHLSVSALLSSFGPLMANWILIEDFEDRDTSRWEGDSQLLQAGIHSEFQGLFEIAMDPLGGNNTYVGRFSGGPAEGDNFGLPGAVAHSTFLPEPIEREGVATLFFRLGVETWEADNVFGLTHQPEWVQFWGDMETIMRYEFTNATFDVYNQSRYETFGFPEQGTWYNVWMVVNAADNSYELYMQGGLDYPEQTRIMSFDGNETFIMRSRASDPIVRFGIIHNINSIEVSFPREPMYLDDLYIDYSGKNLDFPTGGAIAPPEQWAGLAILADGSVETGAYLGRLYVEAGGGWVHSARASRWLHLPEENYRAEGAWLYVPLSDGTGPVVFDEEYTDTGDWLGVVYHASGDWFYSFALDAWILVPGDSQDTDGGWIFAPAP